MSILPYCLLTLATGIACASDDGVALAPTPEFPPEPVELVWATEIHNRDGFGEGITPVPLDGGERIAFVHDGDSVMRVYHLDPTCGAVLDSFVVADPSGRGGQLARHDDRLVMGEDVLSLRFGSPIRFSLRDGTLRWMRVEANLYRPTVTPDAVYGGTDLEYDAPTRLQAYDAETGEPTADFTGTFFPDNERGSLGAIHPHTRPDGSRYLTAVEISFDLDSASKDRSHLLAYDLPSGRELWRRERFGPDNVTSQTPVVYEGVVIQAAADTIHAFDPATGERVWTSRACYQNPEIARPVTCHYYSMSSPVISERDGLVYFASQNTAIVCLDAATGRVLWQDGDHGNFGVNQLLGEGLHAANSFSGVVRLRNRHTGELLGVVENVTTRGRIQSGLYLDEERKLVYGYDGARAFCYRLNFDLPGE